MKLLVLCPGKIPRSPDEIRCFTDVLNYYLPSALQNLLDVEILQIPITDSKRLKEIFSTFPVDNFDAILTLGLRYYSKIPRETTELLRSRFSGLLCQIHDGSRMDYDPVDITFTFKNDDERMRKNIKWYERHVGRNCYMGWAADPVLNTPKQSTNDLRILVDHTNYGSNPLDWTDRVLREIKSFVESNIWQGRFNSVSVRRFGSGEVLDVDISDLSFDRYDRTRSMSLTEITKEHSEAHIFCVTHPESVGLVVLETAMAGALTVSPKNFIARDRLETVRHIEWDDSIDWIRVLAMVDPIASRNIAIENSWHRMSENILNELQKRIEGNK